MHCKCSIMIVAALRRKMQKQTGLSHSFQVLRSFQLLLYISVFFLKSSCLSAM